MNNQLKVEVQCPFFVESVIKGTLGKVPNRLDVDSVECLYF